ncbi:acyl-[ACP]--phospholipid O-acyltransferase [Rhizobium sp. LjRoot30]|uniref:acyl-[ACP]--phospholipid O-acyltransferase n=1 Tax=Rhizobium sp. LjRoot30 TaxID=3342320 RepID=UPI003ECF8CFB
MQEQQKAGPLILSRRFAPLFWTQFFAAFNDNFLKNTLVFLILAKMSASEAASLVTLAGAIFIAPFLLLSALGGELADRFDKAVVARWLKLGEIAAAVVAVGAIAFHSIEGMMAALFLFGVGSALFGPIKYAILPDHLDREQLPAANAWIEGATFIAILSGTIFAGLSFASGGDHPAIFGPLIIGFAAIAWGASCLIPRTGSAAPDLCIDANIVRSTWRLTREICGERRMLVTSLMVSWFWLMGAIVLSILPPLVKTLGGSEIAITAYLTIFAISIAIGSSIAAWLSAGRIVLVQAVIGTVLFGVVAIDLGIFMSGLTPAATVAPDLSTFFNTPGAVRVAIDLALAAVTGAFLIVPSFAALQAWAKPEQRARAVAANNVLNAVFMAFGGVAVAAIQAAGAPLWLITVGLGVASLVAAGLMLRFLPTDPFRDFISILMRAFFRLEVEGIENLAKAGPTPILALNHVSFLDAALALALSDAQGMRPPVFAINTDIAQRWWVRPFLKLANAFPLDPTRPMATRSLIRAVEGGEPLVIFPEGRLTVTGSLMKVYDGAAMVADKTGSMIVPIKIDGLERTIFSRLSSFHTRKQLFPKVRVTIIEPVKLSVSPELKGRKRRQAAAAALYRIMSDLVFATSGKTGTILEEIIKAGHTYGMKRNALEDPLSGRLSYATMLTGARVLATKFDRMFPGEETLGLLLPNANGAVVSLLGLVSAGKVPAMMNFTAGLANLRAACTAADIRTILTSRAFVKQARLEAVIDGLTESGIRIVYLDDLRATVSKLDKIRGLIGRSRPLKARQTTDRAAILFTSGSEGTPKGVVLTHANILANVSQAAARVDFHNGDKVFNVLPVFHSFGLTAGTILPLASGVPVYLYPSPLHYRIIPEAIYSSNATIIFGTDTFLAGYARSAHPYDLRSIRYCFAGAEPVKRSTRETYMDKFGIRILEGYGVTEAAPVVALNTPMYNRPGTVGKLMPGITARLEPVPGVDEGGRLYVSGPNVMAGYLRAENPGVLEVPADGWHDTGDIVTIDEDGFVTIRGRAKRFAKIGGEMVSLAAIEVLAGEVWSGIPVGVVAVADPKKGERLVLVIDNPKANRADLLAHARAKGVSELAIPAEILQGSVPLLGSGKTDFAGLKNYVDMRLAERQAS